MPLFASMFRAANHDTSEPLNKEQAAKTAKSRASSSPSTVQNTTQAVQADSVYDQANDPYSAYGRANDPYSAYGRANDPYSAYGQANDPYSAYGRANDPYSAYGQANPTYTVPGQQRAPQTNPTYTVPGQQQTTQENQTYTVSYPPRSSQTQSTPDQQTKAQPSSQPVQQAKAQPISQPVQQAKPQPVSQSTQQTTGSGSSYDYDHYEVLQLLTTNPAKALTFLDPYIQKIHLAMEDKTQKKICCSGTLEKNLLTEDFPNMAGRETTKAYETGYILLYCQTLDIISPNKDSSIAEKRKLLNYAKKISPCNAAMWIATSKIASSDIESLNCFAKALRYSTNNEALADLYQAMSGYYAKTQPKLSQALLTMSIKYQNQTDSSVSAALAGNMSMSEAEKILTENKIQVGYSDLVKKFR